MDLISKQMAIGGTTLKESVKALQDVFYSTQPGLLIDKSKWIPVTNGRGGFECANCHCYAPSYQNGVEWLSDYCPNCGKKMDGGMKIDETN